MFYQLSPVLRRAIRDTRCLFLELDRDIQRLSGRTSLHCLPGCGHCCRYPELEATLLEFLPLAAWAWDHGRAEGLLARLQSSVGQTSCLLFEPGLQEWQGRCGIYTRRGMICRLFGFAARRDKAGGIRHVACGIMKKELPDMTARVQKGLDQGLHTPLYSEWQQRLVNIHPEWGQRLYPVNQAIRLALETVGYYRELGKHFWWWFGRRPGRQ